MPDSFTFMVNSIDLEGISIEEKKEIISRYEGKRVILCFYIEIIEKNKENSYVSYLFHTGGELNEGALRKEGLDRIIDYGKLRYIILMN